ncbi:hypothetical protein PV04_09766 [Phialophora macrospora]|uniref:Dynamin N-terminal domain-containing protein n=1 Tax=Phialophora macrospora TaxID=1851006 RepID=A0A0D2FS49_9EURO|nr:hypothetical protein PV04_09766 [Phialophora macrospora]
MVESYMDNPRSIILMVVSADQQLANQVVTNLATEADPKRDRTIGLPTKPDTLDGQDKPTLTREFLDRALNKVHLSQKGWYVVRNRSHNEQGMSFEDPDAHEAERGSY